MRIIAAALLCLLTTEAHAFTCEEVRAFVAQHGKAKAIAHAVKHGATWTQLREARKCLITTVDRSATSS